MQPSQPNDSGQQPPEPDQDPNLAPEAPEAQEAPAAPASGVAPADSTPSQEDKEEVASEIGLTAVQATEMSNQPPSEFSGFDLTDGATAAGAQAGDGKDVAWEASEYIHHEKDMLWFGAVAFISLIFIGLAVWLQAWSFIVLIVVMAAALIVFARRPPRTLHYNISSGGFAIENKQHSYNEYRAFSIVKEEPLSSVILIPRKRFTMPIDLFFDPRDGERIVDALSAHLPAKPFKPDFMDKIARRMHL